MPAACVAGRRDGRRQPPPVPAGAALSEQLVQQTANLDNAAAPPGRGPRVLAGQPPTAGREVQPDSPHQHHCQVLQVKQSDRSSSLTERGCHSAYWLTQDVTQCIPDANNVTQWMLIMYAVGAKGVACKTL